MLLLTFPNYNNFILLLIIKKFLYWLIKKDCLILKIILKD